jgi:hypothetical protein
VAKSKDSIGVAYLEIDSEGFYTRTACDFGTVPPDDELSRSFKRSFLMPHTDPQPLAFVFQVMEQYACCSRDGKLPACGQKYDSIGMAYLDIDNEGFYKCSTCDFGIVAPDDELSRSEPDGSVRIRKARFRREAAMLAKENLTKSLKPLEAMIAELEGVDPPDFGSFTDWMQRRQELLLSGQAKGVHSYNCSF